ncbi:MAG TPA: YihY/virulence factor BrkB family protein, partial [Opitutaceae bacterium]
GHRPARPGVRLADLLPRLAHIYQREIWQAAFLRDRSLKGRAFAVLRVLSITLTVFAESRIATRAAALSFSSVLGIGPIIALSVLIAGFALGGNNDDPYALAKTLNSLVKLVAPQIAQYESVVVAPPPGDPLIDPGAAPALPDQPPATPSPTAPSDEKPNPELVILINNIIGAAKSGTGGVPAAFTLLIIVLLLFKNIEDTFNDIWGVRQGRSVITRIVFYWTILTLGAIFFFATVALLNASTFLQVFTDKLPGGSLLQSLGLVLPTLSFTLLTTMLTLFYRVIPNTRVFWRAAFFGGLVVAALLVANNFVAVLYLKRVVLEKSLYGSLALPLVVMSSLYIFWLCVLTGGIVSYAVQNVHFRNSQAAWSTLAEAMRERLALVVFLTICRRFRDCLPPISVSQLTSMLRVPTQLLNECLNRLVLLKLVAPLRPDPSATAGDTLYQPARPLASMTLYDFKTLDDNFGENPLGSSSLEQIDPLVGHYESAVAKLSEHVFFQKTIDQLFDEHPFEESRPPFALGSKRG